MRREVSLFCLQPLLLSYPLGLPEFTTGQGLTGDLLVAVGCLWKDLAVSMGTFGRIMDLLGEFWDPLGDLLLRSARPNFREMPKSANCPERVHESERE